MTTYGIGTQTPEQALTSSDMTTDLTPIQNDEFHARIAKAQGICKQTILTHLLMQALT